MKFSIASPKDKGSISKLWMSCFDCSEEYFEIFYTKCAVNSRTYIAIEDDLIVSCATVISSNFISDTLSKGGYLYGVCTLPEYRGKGYAKGVVEFAYQESLKWGLDYMVTRPANGSLFKFYRDLGFSQTLYRNKITLPLPSSTEKIQYKGLKYDNIVPIRKQFLQRNYFAWNPQYYGYILCYLERFNGVALEFQNSRYLIGHPDFSEKNTFNILELGHPMSKMLRYPTLYYAENIIKELYPETDKINLYLPPMAQYNDIPEGEIKEFALVRSEKLIFNKDSFFNFSAE